MVPRARSRIGFLELHYSFFLDTWGTVIVGLFAVLLCLLGGTGVWLGRYFWRHFLQLRWRASGRIFCSDLHKVVGITAVVFNLILGFTGAWWNLQSAPGLFSAPQDTTKAAGPLFNHALSVDGLVARAADTLPGLDIRHVYINFPPHAEDGIRVRGALPTRNPFRSSYGSHVTFDPQTGVVKEMVDIRTASLWTQTEDMFGPLHFGSFGGVPIKILWCLGGLAPGVLAVTGALIWWQRHAIRRARR